MTFCAGSGLLGHERPKRENARVGALPQLSASKPKSVEERLVEVDSLGSQLSGKRLRDIKRHIRESAMDFGEIGPVEAAPLSTSRAPSLADIQRVVAAHFGITPDNILSHKTYTIVRARQVAAYLTRTLTRLSLNQVRKHFGGGHHTTVMYSVRVVEALMETDMEFAADIARLKEVFLS